MILEITKDIFLTVLGQDMNALIDTLNKENGTHRKKAKLAVWDKVRYKNQIKEVTNIVFPIEGECTYYLDRNEAFPIAESYLKKIGENDMDCSACMYKLKTEAEEEVFKNGDILKEKDGGDCIVVFEKGDSSYFMENIVYSKVFYRASRDIIDIYNDPISCGCVTNYRKATYWEYLSFCGALKTQGKYFDCSDGQVKNIFIPQDGEICSIKSNPKWIFACRKEGDKIYSYVEVVGGHCYPYSRASYYNTVNSNEITPATDEQKKEFEEVLAKHGYKWNSKSLKVEELLNNGALVIAWDDDPRAAIIGILDIIIKPWNVLNEEN